MEAEKWRSRPLKTVARFGFHPRGQPSLHLFIRQMTKVFDRQGDRYLSMDQLQRLIEIGQVERSPHNGMTTAHVLQGLQQFLRVERSANMETAEVNNVVTTIFAVKDQSRLGVGWWIGVFYVGRFGGQLGSVFGRHEAVWWSRRGF